MKTPPTVHPFPARMAPELAIATLQGLPRQCVVLDPMAGSGTVLRHATDMGYRAIGFDLDPLAVLMSRVWTRPLGDRELEATFRAVLRDALASDPNKIVLPWIDHDSRTRAFITYWFGKKQQDDLRCLSDAILSRRSDTNCPNDRACLDVMKIALSRIIITKEQAASLARDTSHSRPHRVATSSTYSVFDGFERSVNVIRARLQMLPPRKTAEVALGDARNLPLPDQSVDLIITSPPYLNAIDYIRGHRLSLVWLGYRLSELREIRRASIGAERAPDYDSELRKEVMQAMGDVCRLQSRYKNMLERYASDLFYVMKEITRLLKPLGRTTVIVGNSSMRGVFIRNSDAIVAAARSNGLQLIERFERELPPARRYLPLTKSGSLGKRMTTETILDFQLATN